MIDLDTLSKTQLKELAQRLIDSQQRLRAVALASRRSTYSNALLAKCLEALTPYDLGK
jgi:hypothetical protein